MMQITRSNAYVKSLKNILRFISKDSKRKAVKFERKLNIHIDGIVDFPYKYRKSFYYSDENIRDCIYKGYTIPYLIDNEKDVIIILDIFKWIDR